MGVDPGVTTGIAILDVNGNLLDVYSKRDATKPEVITRILDFGVPVIVASDVSSPPKSVEKIATKVGAVLYSPPVSPSLNEKRDLTKNYSSLKNDHEVDALSAAIRAWKQHRVLFSKVGSILESYGKQESFTKIILRIMKEESPNIEDAIRGFIEKEEIVPRETMPKKEIRQDFVVKLETKLKEKQKEIDALRNQNILLSKALNEIRKKVGELGRPKEKITEPEGCQHLKDSIEHIKKLRRIENKGYYPVIELGKVTGDLVEQLNEKSDLEERVILVKNTENLNLLNNENIKCLLAFDELKNIEKQKLEFPVVKIGEEMLESFDDIKAVKIDYIEGRLADAKRYGLIGWLKGYRERRS